MAGSVADEQNVRITGVDVVPARRKSFDNYKVIVGTSATEFVIPLVGPYDAIKLILIDENRLLAWDINNEDVSLSTGPTVQGQGDVMFSTSDSMQSVQPDLNVNFAEEDSIWLISDQVGTVVWVILHRTFNDQVA